MRVETNGWTDRRTDSIALTRSVTRSVNCTIHGRCQPEEGHAEGVHGEAEVAEDVQQRVAGCPQFDLLVVRLLRSRRRESLRIRHHEAVVNRFRRLTHTHTHTYRLVKQLTLTVCKLEVKV